MFNFCGICCFVFRSVHVRSSTLFDTETPHLPHISPTDLGHVFVHSLYTGKTSQKVLKPKIVSSVSLNGGTVDVDTFTFWNIWMVW